MSCDRGVNGATEAGRVSGGIPETASKSAAAEGSTQWKRRAKVAALASGGALVLAGGYFGASRLAIRLTVSRYQGGIEALQKAVRYLEEARGQAPSRSRDRLLKQGEIQARSSFRQLRIAGRANAALNTLGAVRRRKPISLGGRGQEVALKVLRSIQKLRQADRGGIRLGPTGVDG